MFYIIENKTIKKSRKTTNSDFVGLSMIIDYLIVKQYNYLTKNNRKLFLNEINSFVFEDINNFLSNQKIKSIDNDLLDFFPNIIELINKSIPLKKVKYIFDKQYNENSINDLEEFLNIHKKCEKYFRNKLKTQYSEFSKSFNNFLYLPKVK